MSTLTSYNGLEVVTPDPTGAGGLAINNNFKALSTNIAASDPSGTNNSTQGYTIGSRWYNSSTTIEWVCTNAAGTATWIPIASGAYLPLAGGTMTGTLAMGAHDLDMDGGPINFGSGGSLQDDGDGGFNVNGNLTMQYGSILYPDQICCETYVNDDGDFPFGHYDAGLWNLPHVRSINGVAFGVNTLTDGASIAWDTSLGAVAVVTLAGNRTLANPTNLVSGATYILKVVQDGSGSRTLAYGAAFKWPGGTTPVLSTTAGAIDMLTFVSFDGSTLLGVIQKAFA